MRTDRICTYCAAPVPPSVPFRRGYCRACYLRWWRHGSLDHQVPRGRGRPVGSRTRRCPVCGDRVREASGYCGRACAIAAELGA